MYQQTAQVCSRHLAGSVSHFKMFTAFFLRGWEGSEKDLESLQRYLGGGRVGDCHPDPLGIPEGAARRERPLV